MTRQTTDLGGRGERPTYDYIVIGAGPAGCAVAARLAQSSTETSVALIEAGPAKASMLSDVPLGTRRASPTALTTKLRLSNIPQKGLGGRKGYQPRGRGLGGSSLINAMIYTRGQPQDYDDWAALGCKGWDWTGVLPYFKRAENNARGADAWHGAGGPLHVSDLSYRNPAVDAFVEAAVQAGFPRNADFNGAHAGRRRALSAVPEEWPPIQCREGLSAIRAAAEFDDPFRSSGAPHRIRRQAGGRRRLSPRRRRGAARRATRDHRVAAAPSARRNC